MNELPANLVTYLELVSNEIWPDCDSCIYYEIGGGNCLRHAPRPVSLRLEEHSPHDDTFATVFRPFIFGEESHHACGEWVGFRSNVDFAAKKMVFE